MKKNSVSFHARQETARRHTDTIKIIKYAIEWLQLCYLYEFTEHSRSYHEKRCIAEGLAQDIQHVNRALGCCMRFHFSIVLFAVFHNIDGLI